ncbi:ABC transporter ATP-binding protein [Legionella nagasakiensis]|uniref:ABC transporter ATP-binding protein n=1 Tax=Legionella nagasakiensis TaxID=535290 RepID=UPI0010558E4A|nr:sn-glycerol-3-phosphate ABC transporter ATP-binding protein UgpC [Legionella nagasakiensis]
MATVSIASVDKYYDDHIVLNNINLTIERGEFVALVGPSGSGKSTLLRLVAGLDTVDDGRILINEQCVNQIPSSQRDMAMVFQNYALYPHMTVFANMAYGLKMRGMKKTLIRQRVEEVSELLQLKDYLHRKPGALSGGQRQRVAMGRAIVRSPAVFLFDEPLSNLDAKLRTEMRYEIKKLHQQLRTTCLYVTHDQTEAMTLADKVAILNHGKVEQVGTPQELYQYPATLFVASFIGHYPMNFLPGKIDLSCQKIITTIGIELPLPNLNVQVTCGQNVMIGVRPEHIKVGLPQKKGQVLAQIEFIDDVGSDRFLKVITNVGKVSCTIRVLDDVPLPTDNQLTFDILLNKASLFCQQTGLYLGGWNG